MKFSGALRRLILFFGLVPALLGQRGSPDLAAVTAALGNRQFDRALELVSTALEQYPHDARLWTLQGIALSGKGRSKDALSSFRTSLKFSPDYLPAIEGAAQIEYEAGSEAAVPLLEHVLRLRPHDQTSHAMLAVIAYRHHDCHKCVRNFEQSGPLLDSQVGALQEYGSCLVRLKQLDQAMAAFQRALDSHPDNPDARYQLAAVQLQTGHADQTIETLTPALQSGLADDRAMELAASAYEAKGDTPQAVTTLRQAIVKNPRNTDLYLDFADLCIQHQSFQTGVDMINSGLSLQPKVAPLYLARGILYVQLARFDDAEADFEKADVLDPRNSFAAAALGLQAVEQHDPDQALATLRAKLAKRPNEPFLLYLQADILTQKGPDPNSPDFQMAVRSATRAVALEPRLVPAHDLLAKLYLQAGKNEQAVQQCRKALENDPKDQTALYHLIQALRKTGQKDELPELLKQLAELRRQATQQEREHNRYKLVTETSLSDESK